MEYVDTGSTARRVFAAPELLEMIVLQLPVPDILTNAQRIAQFWKATIDGSKRIQRKIFLMPDGDAISPRTSKASSSDPKYEADIKLNDMFEWDSTIYKGYFHALRIPHWSAYGLPAYLNHGRSPLLMLVLDPLGLQSPGYELDAARKRRESWLSMFISTPPVTTVHVSSWVKFPGGEGPFRNAHCDVRDQKGVTFGLLADVISKVWQGLRCAYEADGYEESKCVPVIHVCFAVKEEAGTKPSA